MNFVAQVEDHLRDLGAEARKTHPGVKEASERAILHLRSLQTQYVAAVRRAGASSSSSSSPTVAAASASAAQSSFTTTTSSSSSSSPPQHPTTALFQSQDVLRPFLLAAKYPDASHALLAISLESMQLLLRGDAVCPEDGAHISRVLGIQAWGCAGRLGLIVGGGGGGGTAANSGGSIVAAGGGNATPSTGTSGMAAGMIQAASSSVSGALGGITGLVLGGNSRDAVASGTNSGAVSGNSHLGSIISSHHHNHHASSSRTTKEDQSIALKILQTITMLVDSRSMELTQDVFGACLLACLLLGAGKFHVDGGSKKEGTAATYTYSSSLLGSIQSAPTTDGKNSYLQRGSRNSGNASSAEGAAGNVRRAASATMNQIISIVFERAKDVMADSPMVQLPDNSHARSPVHTVALRTLTDLCALAGHFVQSDSGQRLLGPFAIPGREGLAPSPITCLALLDMVFKQQCKDFFEVGFSACKESAKTQQHESSNPGLEFAIQIITPVCQLVLSILKMQHSQHYASSASSSESEMSSTSVDFCFFYYATVLASKILTGYLVSLTSEFYTRFDSISSRYALVSSDVEESATLSKTMQNIITLLVKFVSAATEAYQKSDVFEDGYVFSQTERESLNIGKENSPTRSSSSKAAAHSSTSHPVPDPLISNNRLWRAFLALEVLHLVARSNLEEMTSLSFCVSCQEQREVCDDGAEIIEMKDRNENARVAATTAALIAGAASDFATISASNRERILHVVLTAHDDQTIVTQTSDNPESKSGIHNRDDESTFATGISSIAMDDGLGDKSDLLSAASTFAAKLTDALDVDSVEVPLCDAGAATWLAFKCILSLVRSLKHVVFIRRKARLVTKNMDDTQSAGRLPNHSKLEPCELINVMLDGSFAPSVSVLQHYIKRMYGSHVIVSQTVSSYEDLAYASIAIDRVPDNLRRHAILTSLCKLCLPSWGKKRANTQLKESNVDSIWAMIRIIHSHYDEIYDEWHAILSTLDQLSNISVSSSKLPASYTGKANAIAGCFIRLPDFTTCFSREALSHFISSLVKLSEVVSFKPLVEQTLSTSAILPENSSNLKMGSVNSDHANVGERVLDKNSKEPSLGGKLMSFAGRAFGGGPAESASKNTHPSFRRSISDAGESRLSKTYSDDFREATCLQMASMKISTPRSVFRKLPLPLLLLTVVAEANAYRFSVIEETVAIHLCEIVARSPTMELRSFAMEMLIYFMPLSLLKSETSLKFGKMPISTPIAIDENKPFKVVPSDIGDSDAVDQSNQSGPNSCSPQNELQLLKRLCQTIQNTNQMETAKTGLNALHIVLEGAGHNLAGENLITVVETLSVLSGSDLSQNDNALSIDRTSKLWANASALAFQNLKLIVNNFLEPSSTLDESQLKSSRACEAILDCCVSFGKSRHDVNTSLTAIGMLWSLADQGSSPGTLDLVLSKLASLALDNRAEVRNCSVNTLFSCVVGLGHSFTDEQWKTCLNNTILFGIMREISFAINGSGNQDAGADEGVHAMRYKVAVHHSRDSASKQWTTTQVLALRGLERVLRLFFSRLIATSVSASQTNEGEDEDEEPWLMETWKEILRISLDCASTVGERETLEMRSAGIELLVLCAQVSCKAGIGAAATTARVGTNMEVVGGALRSVRAATTAEDKNQGSKENDVLVQPEVEEWRQHLFHLSFSALGDYRLYLEENEGKENTEHDAHYAVDSVLSQVLTKLSGELAKLYECCKNDEMLPGPCELRLDIFVEENGSYESQLVNMLIVMVNNAEPDKKSRYLNQVQRGCMSLLQVMASNSSLRAFKALTALSGDSMFVKQGSATSGNSTLDDDGYGELFELEAAKTVASAFDSDEMSNEAKAVVMCSVLAQYLKIHGDLGGADDITIPKPSNKETPGARYDILTSVIDSGLQATAYIDASTNDKSVLDTIWDRIIAAVSLLLLPSSGDGYDGYANNSKSFLNIIAVFLLHLPPRKYSLAESMLEKGANRAVEVAFEQHEEMQDQHAPSSKIIDGAIDVFLACFMGLCQKMPTSATVKSLTDQILGGAIESVDFPSTNSGRQVKTRQSLALAICESLKTTSSEDLLVATFPLLCRLTNVESDNLRQAAGKILGGINLADVITCERERTKEAEMRAREIEDENNALLEEIDYLQAENEELQRQLAVFSESSDFT